MAPPELQHLHRPPRLSTYSIAGTDLRRLSGGPKGANALGDALEGDSSKMPLPHLHVRSREPPEAQQSPAVGNTHWLLWWSEKTHTKFLPNYQRSWAGLGALPRMQGSHWASLCSRLCSPPPTPLMIGGNLCWVSSKYQRSWTGECSLESH